MPEPKKKRLKGLISDYYGIDQVWYDGTSNDDTDTRLLDKMIGNVVSGKNSRTFPTEYVMPSVNPLGAKIGSLIREWIQKGVGRVVTNILSPVGYSDKFDKFITAFNKKNIQKSIRAIIDDKPSYLDPKSEKSDYLMHLLKARDLPYRKMFGLEPRYDTDQYVKNVDGSYSFTDRLKTRLKESQDWNVKTKWYDEVMSSFDSGYIGDSTFSYRDKWDFGLNKGETVFSKGGFLRSIMNTITDPITIKGQIDLRKKK